MISIIHADITTLRVDAIVNAANPTLLGGGGVDGAIHRAAGSALLAACRGLGGCAAGEARITPGFGLSATWVIHTVGPVWQGGDAGEAGLLALCYRRSIELALAHAVRRIAFPAISTGVYGFPKKEATTIALSTLREYETQFEEIICCCYSEDDQRWYAQMLAAMAPGG